MRAIVCTKYGSPEVLELKEIEKPTPKDDEVLIKVYASSVNAGDCRIRSFTYAPWFKPFGRILFGYHKPRKEIPGDELSGIVESIGKNVKLFNIGDQVFGISSKLGFGGTNAEYKCLPENKMVTIKPVSMSYAEAAVLPFGGLSALHFLRKGEIRTGQRILINGASGGVGTFAVQIAKYLGAHVTAVCSSSNMELVTTLGADKVIDYTKEDFTKSGQIYDVIFDTVMKTSFSRCKNLLTPKGVYLTVDWPFIDALWASLTEKRKLIYGIAPIRNEDLVYLRELVDQGHLKSVIDRCYPLEQIVDAHKYVDKGHKKGNVVINVVSELKT